MLFAVLFLFIVGGALWTLVAIGQRIQRVVRRRRGQQMLRHVRHTRVNLVNRGPIMTTIVCSVCHTVYENVEGGAAFNCTSCGAPLAPPPAPRSERKTEGKKEPEPPGKKADAT